MQQKEIVCLAAVARKAGAALSIERVRVAPPQQGEVRLRVLRSAICATDEYTLSGQDPEGVFPCILGHEAVGIVESVGEGVVTCKPGDLAIPCYQAECFATDRVGNGTCVTCRGYECDLTNLCGKVRSFTGRGLMARDGGTRFSFEATGERIYHFMGTSTFSEYTVVHQESVAVIPSLAPLNTSCLLGCGLSTGLGAAWNAAKVTKCSSCVIFGAGAVGLAVIDACRIAGATTIIAVDKTIAKRDLALLFGATDFLALSQTGNVVDKIICMTNGGADFTFECVGNVEVMRQALESAAKGWGVSVIVGVAGAGGEIKTRPFQLVTGRTWKGTAFGGWHSRRDLPILVEKMMKNEFKSAEYVTRLLPLARIEEGFTYLRRSVGLRSVVVLQLDGPLDKQPSEQSDEQSK